MARYVKEWEHKSPFFLGDIALRKTRKGDGWSWCSIERVGDDFLVGVKQCRPRKSGPRKGKMMFYGESERCVVTRQELESEKIRYEAETGKCWLCGGVGSVSIGHSIHNGTLVDDCERCKATGKAGKVAR